MYVVIRRTKLSVPAEEAARRTRDHVVPLVQGRPGFRGYCAFVAEQGDAAVSGSVSDDRDTAMDAHRRVRQWVGADMRDLMPEEPEVVAGETVFDSIAHPQEQTKDRQRPLFVVVRTYHGLPGRAEAMHSAASQHTLPAVTDAPGFRGFYALRDEAEPDRAVSVSLFDSREDAAGSHERVVRVMREELGEMAYGTPESAMGETVVLATA
jgi:heme-degrading monooxygenase HmoA